MAEWVSGFAEPSSILHPEGSPSYRNGLELKLDCKCMKFLNFPRKFVKTREAGEFLSGALAGAMTKSVLARLVTIRICADCNYEIGHGRFLSCMGAVWHPECFRCHACNQPIADYEGHYHMPETRGLCLSEEQNVSTILRRPRIGIGNRVLDMRTEPYKLTCRCEVTAIHILYGLPRLLTGSILAHEMMHACDFKAIEHSVKM